MLTRLQLSLGIHLATQGLFCYAYRTLEAFSEGVDPFYEVWCRFRLGLILVKFMAQRLAAPELKLPWIFCPYVSRLQPKIWTASHLTLARKVMTVIEIYSSKVSDQTAYSRCVWGLVSSNCFARVIVNAQKLKASASWSVESYSSQKTSK